MGTERGDERTIYRANGIGNAGGLARVLRSWDGTANPKIGAARVSIGVIHAL